MPPAWARTQWVRSIRRRSGGSTGSPGIMPEEAQDIQDAGDPHLDERPLQPARAPRLVDHRGHARGRGHAAERPLRPDAAHDQRDAEGVRQLGHPGIGEVGPDLRVVRALAAARVQVEPEVALPDDLAEQGVGQARGERPLGAAREAAVQVAAVGQAPVLDQEAGHVDHRHRDQRAAQAGEVGVVEQVAQDPDAVELVAMHRGGDEERGTGPAPHHRHRQGDRLGGVGLAHPEPQLGGLPEADRVAAEVRAVSPAGSARQPFECGWCFP